MDEQISERTGPVFHELSGESRKCLRTQKPWREIVPLGGEDWDASPAVFGVKALELELKRRVVNPAFLAAVRSDLKSGCYPPHIQLAVESVLGLQVPEDLTFGQCVRLLRVLSDLRQQDPYCLARSAAGRHLLQLHLGLSLVDRDWVEDLRSVVTRFRNPSAHRAMSAADVRDFE